MLYSQVGPSYAGIGTIYIASWLYFLASYKYIRSNYKKTGRGEPKRNSPVFVYDTLTLLSAHSQLLGMYLYLYDSFYFLPVGKMYCGVTNIRMLTLSVGSVTKMLRKEAIWKIDGPG